MSRTVKFFASITLGAGLLAAASADAMVLQPTAMVLHGITCPADYQWQASTNTCVHI